MKRSFVQDSSSSIFFSISAVAKLGRFVRRAIFFALLQVTSDVLKVFAANIVDDEINCINLNLSWAIESLKFKAFSSLKRDAKLMCFSYCLSKC